jgi:hypothetical protein
VTEFDRAARVRSGPTEAFVEATPSAQEVPSTATEKLVSSGLAEQSVGCRATADPISASAGVNAV